MAPPASSGSTATSNTLLQNITISLLPPAALAFSLWYANRLRRSNWVSQEDALHGHETTHSVIDHFKSLILKHDTTVEEANKKRTTSYYLKMRESHSMSLVMGVRGTSGGLVALRKREIDRILHYWKRGNQSHRTIVAMCDDTTRKVLAEAREKILEPLRYSVDIETKGVWIPELNMIPEEDMHLTVALPWWWHTIRRGNEQLTRSMAQRFKQTLLLEFHYPFQIELERIILLGGKVLVALWRCVGERTTEDGHVIHDRHGENVDPMVRLREEIIRCFITESPDQRRKPLTYQHNMNEGLDESDTERQHTIKQKTPGMGVTADGFLHTTLCRLPLECLSSSDIELDEVHRLCREASATLQGHRMVIDKYRFIETMGEGGESNPCFRPIYDEIIHAPVRHTVQIDGSVIENNNFQTHVAEQHLTIGHANNFLSVITEVTNEEPTPKKRHRHTKSLTDLFLPPE